MNIFPSIMKPTECVGQAFANHLIEKSQVKNRDRKFSASLELTESRKSISQIRATIISLPCQNFRISIQWSKIDLWTFPTRVAHKDVIVCIKSWGNIMII